MILRETQNQNDADDANDAESGIWYRDTSKQRHERHLRHYRHTRAALGSGEHPRNVHVDDHMLCLQNTFPLKAGVIKADTHTNSHILQSESV